MNEKGWVASHRPLINHPDLLNQRLSIRISELILIAPNIDFVVIHKFSVSRNFSLENMSIHSPNDAQLDFKR